MISCVVGLPGGGKSFYATKMILDYIGSGGVVFSNIRLKGIVDSQEKGFFRYKLPPETPAFKYLKRFLDWEYQDGQYSFIDLSEYDESFLSSIPHGSPEKRILLILDEVNEWFDSLDRGKLSSDAKYREMFKFLRLSRHYHIDVCFLLQDFNTLNVRLRGLCGKILKTTDMSNMRIAGIPFKFPFPWFLWHEFDGKGKTIVKTDIWPKDKEIFACYDSFCEFGQVGISGDVIQSNFGSSGRKKKGVKKMSKFERIFLYCCILFLGYMVFDLKSSSASLSDSPSGTNDTVFAVEGAKNFSISTNRALSASVASESDQPLQRVCDYQVYDILGSKSFYVSGYPVAVGTVLPWGQITALFDTHFTCISNDGMEVVCVSSRFN